MPCNPLPTSAPAWAHRLLDWLWRVQDQVDAHSAALGRHDAAINQLRKKNMATQAEIDAVVTELNAAAEEILGEIANLKAQVEAGNTLDLSALEAAAQRLADVVPDAPPADGGDGGDGAA